MNTKISGTVNPNPVLVSSFTLPSKPTSLQNNQNLAGSQIITPTVTPLTKIVTKTTTKIVDLPGFVPVRTPVYFTIPQTADVRSAAINTAIAFGLNVPVAADRAVLKQKTLADFTFAAIPAQVDDSVIIPP